MCSGVDGQRKGYKDIRAGWATPHVKDSLWDAESAHIGSQCQFASTNPR